MYGNEYGTWTTFDCPANGKDQEAFEFLETEFDKIHASVWKKRNPHDFGTYESFEVDKPEKYEFADIDGCEESCFEDGCEDCDLALKFEKWVEKANEIETLYSKKFFSEN
jgi:hypothetical protein